MSEKPTPTKCTLTGIEANYLLFALDAYCSTNGNGMVLTARMHPGYSIEQVQYLRDKLFMYHEHPEDYDA